MSAVDCRTVALETLVAEAQTEDAAWLARRAPALLEALEASRARLERMRGEHVEIVSAPTDRELSERAGEKDSQDSAGAELRLSRIAARRKVAASALGQCAAAESAYALGRLRIGLDAGGGAPNGVNAPLDGRAPEGMALFRQIGRSCADGR